MNELDSIDDLTWDRFELKRSVIPSRVLRLVVTMSALVAGLVMIVGDSIVASFSPATVLGSLSAFLGVTLLVESALTRRQRGSVEVASKASTPDHGVPTFLRKEGRSLSLASDLALLADLHTRGALSADEYSVAKRRLLDM